MNTQLVESLVQVILSLSKAERALLEEKLFFDASAPATDEVIKLAQYGRGFDFLYNEPDIYTIEDGEPIE